MNCNTNLQPNPLKMMMRDINRTDVTFFFSAQFDLVDSSTPKCYIRGVQQYTNAKGDCIMRLTDSEWKIANCLWNNKCMTLTELTRELLDSTGWTKHTIITLVKRMIEKGMVTYDQQGRTKKFYPAIDRAEAELEETTSFIDKVYEGNAGLMIANLIGSDALTEDQLAEIKRLIEEI